MRRAVLPRLSWNVAFPGVVAGLYQPLADNVAIAATSDHTCLLQSTQKAKRSGLAMRRSASLRSPIEAGARQPTVPVRSLKSTARRDSVISLPRQSARDLPGRVSFDPLLATCSAFAPASSSFFLAASASALVTPSLTGFGAPSTRSFASFRPRPVSSRTALMTLTLFSPNDGEHDREFGLLFGGGGRRAAGGRGRDGDGSGGGNAELRLPSP